MFNFKKSIHKITLIAIFLMLLGILTWLGLNKSSAIYTNPVEMVNETQGHTDIHTSLHNAAGTNKALNSLLETLFSDTTNLQNIAALKAAGQSSNLPLFTAYALYLEGLKNKDAKTLQKSASLFFEIGTHDPDSLSDKTLYQNYAIRACDGILKTNPKDLASIVQKATAIVYLGGDIMSGVGLLKQAEQIDSNCVEAQHHLMLLDLQSGQYKKAEKRLKKLVHLQPQNQEYSDLLIKLETQQIK